MCRYATSYKPHFACFACRKVFRRPLLHDIPDSGPDRPFRCPECAGDMANMGLDFAAPKKTDLKAWRVAASLFEVGETFHGCGCTGPGYRPRDPKALRAFLEQRLAEFEANAQTKPASGEYEMTSARTSVWRKHTPEEIQTYWNERAARVHDALAALPG